MHDKKKLKKLAKKRPLGDNGGKPFVGYWGG